VSRVQRLSEVDIIRLCLEPCGVPEVGATLVFEVKGLHMYLTPPPPSSSLTPIYYTV